MGFAWGGVGLTSINAVYQLLAIVCYFGGFGDLGDPVVPTLRVVSGDVVVDAYQDTKGRLLQSIALPKRQNDCFHE